MRQQINKVTLTTAISILSLTIPNKFSTQVLAASPQLDNQELIVAQERTSSEGKSEKSKLEKLKSNIPDADEINRDINDRYQGLVEKDTEKIDLFKANEILKSTDNEIGAEFNQGNPDTNIKPIDRQKLEQNLKKLKQLEKALNSPQFSKSLEPEQLQQLEQVLNSPQFSKSLEPEQLEQLEKILNSAQSSESLKPEQLEQLKKILSSTQSSESEGNLFTKFKQEISSNKLLILASLLVIVGPFAILILIASTSTKEDGLFGKLKKNYGKPKVPDGSIALHERSFKELTHLGLRADKLDDQKFGNAEFLVLLKMKYAIAEGGAEYQVFNQRVELLKAAIAAKNSFLRLEQTELRYRSRKQQEFYSFVAENITEQIDKDEFRDKVKKKLAEVIPLINTEEGRDALQGYLKEVNVISQYDLGLKLLSLFKQYQLADLAILTTVSNIVDRLQSKELLEAKGLISLVLENYDAFEKLSPIIGISEAEDLPKTYASILQYIGLMERHRDSYKEFEELTKVLKKWQKPYKSVTMVRQEYTAAEYAVPKEFNLDIPGSNTYHKYAKYLI